MNYRDAIEASYQNKDSLSFVTECSCYSCLRTFPVSEIVEWIDKGGTTAVCPHCHVDSLLPGEVNKNELGVIYREAFSVPDSEARKQAEEVFEDFQKLAEIAILLDSMNPQLPGAFTGTVSERIRRQLVARGLIVSLTKEEDPR